MTRAEQTILIVGPFYGRCDFAPSPAARLAGYGDHLPGSGIRPVILAPACRCTIREPADGELIVDPEDPNARALIEEAARKLAGDEDPLILRPILPPSTALRHWLELEPAVVQAKMVWHHSPTLEPRSGGSSSSRRSLVGYRVRAHDYQASRRRMLEWCVDGLTDGGFHPDVVLGSHGYAPEVCSAARIARRTGAPLVVELRDALWRQWRPVYESIELARVGGTVRRADAVVHVTPQEQARDRWWLGPHPLQRVIEHGFDEAEWDEIRARARRDDGRFVIRFLGTLYPKLDLRTFLEGFERFIDELPPEQRDRVSFEYVGPSALPDDHARHALIRSVGHVPRQRALALMAETDVLVLPMGSSARSAGIPGGRFYEYLGSGRPILAAGGTVDPYVADVLSRTGAGTAVSGSEAVARELRSLLSERDAAGGGDRKAYTRRRQARELADLVSELLTRT